MDCSPPGSSCPWDFPGKNTGVGCPFLPRGSNRPRNWTQGLLHCQQILYQLNCLLFVNSSGPLTSTPLPFVYTVNEKCFHFLWSLFTPTFYTSGLSVSTSAKPKQEDVFFWRSHYHSSFPQEFWNLDGNSLIGLWKLPLLSHIPLAHFLLFPLQIGSSVISVSNQKHTCHKIIFMWTS